MKKQFYLLLAIWFAVLMNACQTQEDSTSKNRAFNGKYEGAYNNRIAFPIGGMGTGMYCIEGTGFFSHMSVRNQPDLYNEPLMFAALHVKGLENGAKILEGSVAEWRKFGYPLSGLGGPFGSNYGLPRFHESAFESRFPFGMVSLTDNDIPVKVTITAWNPFIPGDADNSSLPVGVLEYTFENNSGKALETVFSFNSRNFMQEGRRGVVPSRVKPIANGFILSQEGTDEAPHLQGDFAIFTDQPNTVVNHCWFRGEIGRASCRERV